MKNLIKVIDVLVMCQVCYIQRYVETWMDFKLENIYKSLKLKYQIIN